MSPTRTWSTAEAEAVLHRFVAERSAHGLGPALADLVARLADADELSWLRVADLLFARREAPFAVPLLDAASRRHPASIALRYRLGNARRLAGDAPGAERELRAVIESAPDHTDAALSLAFLLREQGRLDAASDTILGLWRRHPRTPEHVLRILRFLVECQRHARAEEVAAAALALHPDDPALNELGGEIAQALGRFETAATRLRRALACDPGRAAAWLRLAHTRRFASTDDPDLGRFARALDDPAAAPEVAVCVSFALGKALDDLGERAQAAAILTEANRRQRALAPWARTAWEATVAARLTAPALPAVATDPAFRPVFVVGLPRSGTTLVASLLARHPEVRNRGELNWIDALARHLGGTSERAVLAQAADLVRAQMRQDDAPARVYIDKNPMNFSHLALIAALFPDARVIRCRRDRRDTALSLWMQHFAHADMAWAYDFADIAAVADDEARLVEAARTRFGGRLVDLDYERLVREPDASLTALFDFLELPPAALDERGGGAIATASVWQARQAVYTRSIGRWQHYAAHLPALADLPGC